MPGELEALKSPAPHEQRLHPFYQTVITNSLENVGTPVVSDHNQPLDSRVAASRDVIPIIIGCWAITFYHADVLHPTCSSIVWRIVKAEKTSSSHWLPLLG